VHYLSASDIAAAIARNELTSVAATEHYLSRIERYNPQFNASALCALYPEQLRCKPPIKPKKLICG
jgi:Asp-tRNA(Asn)/Glu-tRNA(Gln) amidotransferase A subunit family amidase